MAKWETEIFRGELCQYVKREYRNLLSVKKTGEEAERLLIDHFQQEIDSDRLSAGRFWMALGLREWQFGRLTQTAKEQAQKCAVLPWAGISANALDSLLTTLDSPMPSEKKVRLPSHVSHCPWPIGSLLVYRIISSKHPHVTESPFYGKYVLLRIVAIRKQPVTFLAPEAGWNEGMLVGLYNWIGDTIPDPETAKDLQFTPIAIDEPLLPAWVLQEVQPPTQSEKMKEVFQKTFHLMTAKRIETCCDLSWKCAKGIDRKDVFTYLDCDPSFADAVDPFFNTDVVGLSLCHSMPFDSMLVDRFSQLLEKRESTGDGLCQPG